MHPRRQPEGVRPVFVGIAGASGSGKTELARGLAEALGPKAVARVSLDDYYRDLNRLPQGLRHEGNFDHPDAIDRALLVAHLQALAEGRPVSAPRYDFAAHARVAGRRTILPLPHVVVEGLFVLFWPDVRRLLHLKVFVRTADAVCLARRVVRDTRDRGREPSSVRAQYERTVRPMYRRYVEPTLRHADLVLPGDRPVTLGVGQILERLRTAP